MAAVELHSEITFFVLSRGVAIITSFCCFFIHRTDVCHWTQAAGGAAGRANDVFAMHLVFSALIVGSRRRLYWL